MGLYQLPGKVSTTLRLYLRGAPAQPVSSLLPAIFTTCLERLADPSPAHHMLRAPFIRPLLNTQASQHPVYSLLSPAYVPKEEEIAPDSPLQAQLIDFFEEQRNTILTHTRIEEDLPVFVYCIHRKGMLGPPQLAINENYNNILNKAGKHAAVVHAISVLCHQMSLMLQSRADPKFNVMTSRRPSDFDSRDTSNLKRAAFTDFQIEKRGGIDQLAGVLQPSYEPRALSAIALSRWYGLWNKPQWDPRATLDFFTTENTISWDSIEDVYKKTVVKGDETVQITVPGRGKRPIAFAAAPTSQEMRQSSEAGMKKSGPLDEEVTGDWEQGRTAARQQERRLNWIDTLSAVDLGRPGDDRKSRDDRRSWDDKRPRNDRRYEGDRRTPRPKYVKMTGSNQAELSRTRVWGGQSAGSSAASSPPSHSEQDLSSEGWMAGSEAHAERRKRSWGSTSTSSANYGLSSGRPSRDQVTRPSRSSRE